MKKIFVLLIICICTISLTSCEIPNNTKYTTNFELVYFYGFFDDFIENDYTARLLYNYNEIDYNIKEPDKPLISGDVLHLTHKGELMCQASYPGKIILDRKNYVDSTYSYTIVVEIPKDDIVYDEDGYIKNIDGYIIENNFVIINENLKFVNLNEYKGEKLFASLKLDQNYQPIINEVAALFSYNPRINEKTP